MPAPFIDPAVIRRRAWGGGYDRGAAYFQEGAVLRSTWDDASGVLIGEVRGSGTQVYRCLIRIDPADPRGPIITTSCSCPVQADCKHIVATLLSNNARVSGDTQPAPRAAPPEKAAPTWRDALGVAVPPRRAAVGLALGVQLRQQQERTSRWTTGRMEPATAESVRDGSAALSVGLRPFVKSASTGKWVKADVSWEVLRRAGGAFDPRQARWFAELHSIARELRTAGPYPDTSEWLSLDQIDSELVWRQLARAEGLGIELIAPARHDTVVLATSAEATIALDRSSDGALTLVPRLEVDGAVADATRVRPVGRAGIYAYDVDGDGVHLRLAPLTMTEPVHALVARHAPLTVPADEVDEFLRDYYPQLARRAPLAAGGDLVLPEIAAPQLVVHVDFRARGAASYRLSWRYAAVEDVAIDAAPGPGRDHQYEAAVTNAVETAWADAAELPYAASGSFTDVAAAEFVAQVLPVLEAIVGVVVEVTGTRPRYRELTAVPEIAVSTVESTDPDWFELGVIVTIDGHRIPFRPLFTQLALRRKKMLLSDGHYFSLAHPALDRLRELIDEAGDLDEWEAGPRISRYQGALWADFEDLADEALPAVSWRATAEGLRDVEHIPEVAVPPSLRAELRPYQRAGLDWLAFLWQHRLGGILADDMGLGKTLQILALIAHARATGETRPFLVVAPTSVLSTWRAEAERFVPDLAVSVLGATRAKRGTTVADATAGAHLVVTSYTLLRLDEDEFAGVAWAGVILDEAQFVKNAQTRQHRAVRALHADVTIAVTGTPLENTLTELWSLLSLTAPGLFASARRFREDYVGPIEKGKVPENAEASPYRAARLDRLRRRIRPLVLRRTKEHVADDLPPKQEQVLDIELTPAHRALYDTVLQRERKRILGLLDDLDRNRFIVFRSLTLLRMLSLAPELVDPAHAHVSSAKLDTLLDHIAELAAEGHRALVFSQFTSFLSLAAQRLDAAGIPYVYLDGSTRRREEVIDGFRTGTAPVFLISLKAGGFGLTLTEADYVFLLDPWWNPAAEAQAVDRTHRIGQRRSVNVYRMIATGTIEEKVLALQSRKARLFSAVMDDDAMFSQAVTADDIRALLEG